MLSNNTLNGNYLRDSNWILFLTWALKSCVNFQGTFKLNLNRNRRASFWKWEREGIYSIYGAMILFKGQFQFFSLRLTAQVSLSSWYQDGAESQDTTCPFRAQASLLCTRNRWGCWRSWTHRQRSLSLWGLSSCHLEGCWYINSTGRFTTDHLHHMFRDVQSPQCSLPCSISRSPELKGIVMPTDPKRVPSTRLG